jgi:hypothetical protein
MHFKQNYISEDNAVFNLGYYVNVDLIFVCNSNAIVVFEFALALTSSK